MSDFKKVDKLSCPLCETKLENRADEHYYLCSMCFAYVKDKKYYFTLQQEKRRYQEHKNDINDLHYQNFTAPITKNILEKFSKNHLGLDYGCGSAPVITSILKSKNYKIKMYDPFFFPNDDYKKYQYDYIFSCEVFEHFYNPKAEIKKLISLLKPNGLLLIMTHLYNGVRSFNKWYYRRDPTHVFIYTAKTINYISQSFNLDLEKQTERIIIFKKRAA